MDVCSPASFRNASPVPGPTGGMQSHARNSSDAQHSGCMLDLVSDNEPTQPIPKEITDVKKASHKTLPMSRKQQLAPLRTMAMSQAIQAQRREPIMMPSVTSIPELACFGRSLA